VMFSREAIVPPDYIVHLADVQGSWATAVVGVFSVSALCLWFKPKLPGRVGLGRMLSVFESASTALLTV